MDVPLPIEVIRGKIYLIRGQKVLLDRDLVSSQEHQSISGRFHAHTDQRRDQELITNCDKS
jgi:hypothetical protein